MNDLYNIDYKRSKRAQMLGERYKNKGWGIKDYTKYNKLIRSDINKMPGIKKQLKEFSRRLRKEHEVWLKHFFNI